ncbi:unnamed protein product [Zymoseptoria tritici ST99CH_3D1]|nr:unnamed protein product [Zymoseptoria tritici ST99CH_3D1]
MGASESKLAFKQSIFQLSGHDEIHPEDALWSQFYTLPECADDVFSLWSPNDLGNLTLGHGDSRPQGDAQVEPRKNLETLIYTIVARLRLLQTTIVHPGAPVNTSTEIANCMRILTRLFPFIYEAQHLKEWQDRFFWQPRKPTYFWDKKKDRPGRLFDGLEPEKEYGMEDFDTEIGPPLGETLLDLVVKYMFFAGYCIPQRLDEKGAPDLEISIRVWQTGIGSNKSLNCSKENEKFQQETVRLLLAIMSKTMYMQPNEVATADVKALTYMTTKLEKRVVNGILCSLLNTVLKYNPNLWSMPLDIATGAGDSKKLLVTNCLQLVLVLAIYGPPIGVSPLKNQFRQSMSSLYRPDDFQFIQTGMSTVLAQPVSSIGNFTYNLGKDKALPWAPEMISLLWELLQCNRRFRRYLVETGCALDYVVLILYYALDSKDDPSKHGILRMCVFVLQTLSAEGLFAEKLNTAFRYPETLPAILRLPNFHGSYADFLICSIHTIFTTTKGRLESVYPALLIIIKNIAPHQKNLARATSSKLMSLFEMLASPAFLLANDSNNALLISLLEACNLILENHYEENPRFVEVIIGSRKRFRALQVFTIDGALAELDRQGQERKDHGSGMRSPSQTTSFDSARDVSSLRFSTLSNVPEDTDRFAIGDDDDDEADPSSPSSSRAGRTSDSPTRISEKARGKKPAVSLGTTSRNASASSLPSLSYAPNTSNTFRPSPEWLEAWTSRLPLEPILKTIEHAENKQKNKSSNTSGKERTLDATLFSKPATDGSGEQTGDEKPKTAHGASFQWTAFAIGWYNALIWSRIYLQEVEAFQGSGGLYSSTNVVLFKRSTGSQEISLRSPKGAIDAVGNSLAQRISSISMK